jgi:parallel beta-helix repeat protein
MIIVSNFVGDNNTINDNEILLSGRDELGNAIDILGSDHCKITNNNIVTATCRGIFIVSSSNCFVDNNIITGGITWGIRILSSTQPLDGDDYAIYLCHKRNIALADTHDITISNNIMTQNRYGLSAINVDKLTVDGNYFSQRFEDAAQRLFWTDNAILLDNVTDLVWTNNFYKEAFTQVNGGDNSHTQIVVFPSTGGVVI